ncbi:peroxidase 5-like [Alnus glutinosa]|uniref:peroxidase 5-like n=1 Tax=Alnus glutinosa TaxID=3517 RepID=UPI002D7772F1|nr:peroxidase 5-like [Alnus glutinosa]
MEVGRVIVVTILAYCSIFLLSEAIRHVGNDLNVGFYDKTCPQAEQIVADVVSRGMAMNRGNAAGLIRLFFHDCFVNGCDASILLDSTPSGESVEKESGANSGTLRGLEIIDKIKAQLEQECPDIVSCADILSFASREAVARSGLSYYHVPAGRRDGLSSRADDTRGNIPGPSLHVDAIAEIFTRKGLTVEEMVVLTGAHSVGASHCKFFDYRLYNFSSTNRRDPDLNIVYANFISSLCPPQQSLLAQVRGNQPVDFDHISPNRLENTFYLKLLKGIALLESDQGLANDPRTREIVHRMAFNREAWSNKFTQAMIRLGRVDVLTGREGEIRKDCRAVN